MCSRGCMKEDVEEFTREINLVVAERSDYMNYINVDPLFEVYRGEPRFTALLNRIGLDP